MIKEELKNLDTSVAALKKFGITIGTVAGIVTAYLIYAAPQYAIFSGGIAILLIAFGVFIPPVLRVPYILWMALAFVLGFIMTRIILTLLFYLVMTPIGLYLRLTGKDLLKLKTRGDESSYWEVRGKRKKEPHDYEKQF